MELATCFRKLGMAKYPSNVLAAMVMSPNSTALELSCSTGVPYTKIYQVLSSLVAQRFAQVSLERPKRYVAADCQRVVDFLVGKQEDSVVALRRHGARALKEAAQLAELGEFPGEDSHALMRP